MHINSIHQSQAISSEASTSHSAPLRQAYTQSTLLIREPALGNSLVDTVWQSICDFTAYIFSFFGYNSLTPEAIQKLSQKGFIYFYNHKNPMTEWMGNFYPCSVNWEGVSLACSEAIFQMLKFIGHPALQTQFVGLSGDQALKLARQLSSQIRSDWHDVKEDIMFQILEQKFLQNPKLITLLLATGEAYLVEHNEVVGRDDYWSDNHDGSGQNRLGIILMRLRKRFGGHGVVPAPQAYWAFIRAQN